jgi:hypothetical protein
MSDDVALLAIMIREALIRIEPEELHWFPDHQRMTRALREVLDETGSEVHLEPKGSRVPEPLPPVTRSLMADR